MSRAPAQTLSLSIQDLLATGLLVTNGGK